MSEFNSNPDPRFHQAAYMKFRDLEKKDHAQGAGEKRVKKRKARATAKPRAKAASEIAEAARERFMGRAQTNDQAVKLDQVTAAATRAEGICGVVRLYHAGLVTADNLLLVVGNIIQPG